MILTAPASFPGAVYLFYICEPRSILTFFALLFLVTGAS